jgi:hypothetical protein
MLKHTYEKDNQELKAWVNLEDGSLNIQMANETIQIPYEEGVELLVALKDKQYLFRESERKKICLWSKLRNILFGRTFKSYPALEKSAFEAA